MKIESRAEATSRQTKYKSHASTFAALNDPESTGLQLVSAYIPRVGDRPDATPQYFFAFGMDQRRVVLTLDHEELMRLKWQIDEALKDYPIRRIK